MNRREVIAEIHPVRDAKVTVMMELLPNGGRTVVVLVDTHAGPIPPDGMTPFRVLIDNVVVGVGPDGSTWVAE